MSPIAIDSATLDKATPAVKAELQDLAQELVEPAARPVDYARFLSEESASRMPSPLKAVNLKYNSLPGIISFAGGMPHPSTFPVNSLSLSFPYLTKTITVEGFTPKGEATPLSAYTPALAADNALTNINLAQAMQYGGSGGAVQLINFLKEHTNRIHNIPYADWDIMMTTGNTDGADNILRMLASRGSNVLVENFAYPGTLAAMFPLGIHPVPVKLDSEGMVPEAMDEILSSWDEAKQGKKPTTVILVPTGQNPTGTTMTLERKKAFYKVAQKHDIIIISDDPYRALQLHYPATQGPTPPPRIPGFLSIDTDGRVLDLASFSKTVAPGCRCGWITGPTPLIKRLILRNEVTSQAVSGFSVAAISTFLGAIGGQEGYEKYLDHVAATYSRRANIMIDAFNTHISSEYASWVTPAAGMFCCVAIKAKNHPLLAKLGAEGVLEHVFDEAIKAGVVTASSTMFKADPTTPSGPDEIFLRCSFSYVDEQEIVTGAKRLGDAIRNSFTASA